MANNPATGTRDYSGAAPGSKTEFEAAYQAGLAYVHSIDPCVTNLLKPVLVTSAPAHLLDLSEYLARPLRKEARVAVSTEESFVQYVNAQRQDSTVLFSDGKSSVTGVLDYHGKASDAADWCDHTVVLTLPKSAQWTKWTSLNNQPIDQTKFQEFLEDTEGDIVEPDGATILECARNFEETRTAVFKSAQRLHDGTRQLNYQVSVNDQAKQAMVVPQKFKLLIPIWDRSEPVEVSVRLRYDVRDGKLTFKYIIDRMERVIQDSVNGVLTRIAASTGLVPMIGSPS